MPQILIPFINNNSVSPVIPFVKREMAEVITTTPIITNPEIPRNGMVFIIVI